MTSDPKIIVPGSDSPGTISKLLEAFATQQRVCTLIVRRGERFVLKIVEMRKELVVGEVRCLHWSPEMSRKIWLSYQRENQFSGEGKKEILLADAIDQFGGEAHRFRVYIPLDEVTAVYEDLDDRFDQTPYQHLP